MNPERKVSKENILFLSQIVESSDDAIIGKTLDGIITSWNRGAEKTYGYQEAEVLGKPISLLVPLEFQDEEAAFLQTIKSGGRIEHYSTWIVTKDKRNIFVSLTISPVIDAKGKIIGASTIARDITQQKQLEDDLKKSEARFSDAFKHAPIAIYEVDIQSQKLIRVNDYVCKFLGYSREELLNMTVFDLLSDSSKNIFTERLKIFTITGKVDPSTEYKIKAKNGFEFDVIVQSIFLPGSGKHINALVFAYDITAHKQAEESLKEELLIRARFIDILAHELRGPLSPILNSSEILLDLLRNNNDDILKRLSSNIQGGAKTLANRLDELLDLARYSRGVFKLNTTTTDISKFVAEVVSRYQPAIDQSNHKLTIHLPQHIPNVAIDSSKMEQVLVNLLSNASKYSPANTRIELSVNVDHECLKIDITDQGQGISEIDQKHLFQPYHRLKTDMKKASGLGLGLTICKQIVEAHSGRLKVQSKTGSGSTFSVVLPLGINPPSA